MLPLPREAVWQLFFLLSAVLLFNEVRAEERVVCYYTNWSVYRPGTAKFNPQNINPYLCTHLIYAFGGFTKDNTMKPFDKYQDIEQGGYAKFTGLKTYNKQLKTMIAIGGWNEASSRFSPLVASSERRQQFIKNILKFLRQNHFDGLDLDWEYPAHREGGKSRDRDNYAQFVQELRAEFDRESSKTGRPRLLLTMAVPAGIQYIEKGYDIPKLNKYLDWFNMLTYDFHSSTEPSANHHAPLYSLEEEDEYNYDSELNIDYSIKFYLDAGADRDKLVLGIPTYGRSYTLFNEESTELGAPADGPGEQGDATREKGYLAYYEICQNIKEDPDWTVVQPNPKAMGPYAFKGNQWVGYDDEAIVRKKAEYVVENGLGGIMFWAIDNDDFRGLCTGKPYPLIEAAKEAYLDRLGVGANEVAKPSSPKKKPLRNRNRNSSANRNKVEDVVEKVVSVSRKKPATRARPQTERPTKTSTTTGSSLYVGGRTTTPAPPTTPDPGSDFKCEDEGFFQHPRDCKKYFWCLDSGPSNLGIVAHQFTCPSGLYFNPSADSCDFARNVPCDKKNKEVSTTTSRPSTTTTTTQRTTTSAYRITAATSRNSFARFTSTTTEAPEDEEDEYEDEPEDTVVESEEDPRVIKELIDLIKKVGGIEELEKHILQQDDGTVMLKKHDSSSSGVTTTPSSISKKLYEKVLSRPTNLSAFRNKFTSSSLFRSTSKPKTVEEDAEEEVEENEEDSDKNSKYSSVVRNSRPGPQNAGIEKLPEFEGFLKEKKKYVTIRRPRPSSASSSELNEEENDNLKNIQQDSEDDDDNDEDDKVEALSVSSSKRPISASTPAYTSIRRTKGTTVKPEIIQNDEEVEDIVEDAVSDKKTYVPLNRNRVRSTTEGTPLETESTTISGSRYKFLERSRPTRRVLTTIPTSKEQVDEENAESEDPLSVTVQYLEPIDISTQSPTQQQQAITTRTYSSIGRRTTTTTSTTVDQVPITTTLPESFLSDTTTPEPIIISTTTTTSTTQTTTNPTSIETSTQSSTTTTPILPALSLSTTQRSSTLQDEEDATIAPKIPNSQVTESGLDTQELDSTQNQNQSETTTTTTATTDDTDRNEVTNPTTTSTTITTTKTPSSIKSQSSLNSSNSIRGTFNNKFNGGGSRRQQQQRTKSTTLSTDTTQETSTSTNEFLGTVSSPRPFGFPRRRTRPTLATKSNGGLDDNASSLSSSTASPSETSTPAIIKKVRTKVPVRRPNIRRRLFTTTQPASSNSTDELNTDGTSTISSITTIYDASSTAAAPTTSLFKNNRRTRPNYLTTISAKLKPTAKALSSSSNPVEIIASTISTTGSATTASGASSNDITFVTVNKLSNQKSPSGVIRRKFTRPLNGNRLTNSTATTTTTTSSGSGSMPTAAETSEEVATDVLKTQNPLFKRRFPSSTTSASVTTIPPGPIEFNTSPLFLDTSIPDDLDQIAKSSIQESKFFHNQIGDNLDEHEHSGKVSISTSIFRSTTPIYTTYEEPITRRLGYAASTRRPSLRRPQKTTPIPENVEIFISRRRPQKTPTPFNKIIETSPGQTYKPSSDYDYYDDGDERVIDKPTASQVKVVLHGKGIIECLDQGNFPHPLSCRKFISCAKFETGGVVGWEYTCPKGLSYDPVGGMCNWSAGLGCNE